MNQQIEQLQLAIEFCDLAAETAGVYRQLLALKLASEEKRQAEIDQLLANRASFGNRLQAMLNEIPLAAAMER